MRQEHNIEEPQSDDPLLDGHVMPMPPFILDERVNKTETLEVASPSQTQPTFEDSALQREAERANIQPGSTDAAVFRVTDKLLGSKDPNDVMKAVNLGKKERRKQNPSAEKTSQNE